MGFAFNLGGKGPESHVEMVGHSATMLVVREIPEGFVLSALQERLMAVRVCFGLGHYVVDRVGNPVLTRTMSNAKKIRCTPAYPLAVYRWYCSQRDLLASSSIFLARSSKQVLTTNYAPTQFDLSDVPFLRVMPCSGTSF
jgi:hypothetical protein